MFLDKDNHLAKLNELYGQNCFQSASLYCDAGMGKTTLLRQFSAGKRTLYFKPLETTDRENFLALKEEAIRVLGALENPPKRNLCSLLLTIFHISSIKTADYPH